MQQPIISVSGLRGIVGKTLTPDVALHYTCAFAALIPAGPVVLGRDGRSTGPMIAAAVRSGLAAVGRRCLVAGVASTPTCGRLVRARQAAGGLQITASHNPAEYDGIKLFNHEGRVLPADVGAEVRDRYASQVAADWVPHHRVGSVEVIDDTLSDHLAAVLACIDVARIRARKFRVLLDANHGAGGELGARLLKELGCDTTVIGAAADGRFQHGPEPTEANLADVAQRVRQAGVDVAFCQDPDADRLAIVDQQGQYVGEEYTLALAVDHVLRSRPGPVVTNCASSRMVQDLAEQYGVACHRAAVGEANVVDRMLVEGAVLGGEGNGGVIDLRVGPVRDSFVAMAYVLDALAAEDLSVSQRVRRLPKYEIHKTRTDLAADRVAAALDALVRRFPDAAPSRLDGLRLDWSDRWLLVRASNTEPIVRIIAEGKERLQARQLCDQAREVLEPLAAP